MKLTAFHRGPATMGVIVLFLFAGFMFLLMQKSAVLTALKPGDTLIVEFARQYKLVENRSEVKLAGTPVGVVSEITNTEHGTVTLSLKLDEGTVDKLGSKPSAEIRTTTVLGGKYYVSLIASGDGEPFTSEAIPVERTRVPVELDTLLRAVPPKAQDSLQDSVARLDETMQAGAGKSLRGLVQKAPETLKPAKTVLDAAQGSRKGTDLADLVTHLNRIAQVATQQDGQTQSIVDHTATLSQALADSRQSLADTVETMPETLRLAKSGSRALSDTLDQLETTAESARPSIRELDILLRRLDPTLVEARPVLRNLKPLLEKARPMVEELVPTTRKGTTVLDHVRGPVLNRLNGPIIESVMSEWHGQAPKYPNGGNNGNKLYEEIGYMFANWNNGTHYFDDSGGLVAVQPGVGPRSVANPPGGLGALLDLGEGLLYDPPHQDGSDKHARDDAVPGLPGILKGLIR